MKMFPWLVLLSLVALNGPAAEMRKRILIDEILTLSGAKATLETLQKQNVELTRNAIMQNEKGEAGQRYVHLVLARAVEKYAVISREIFSWSAWETRYVAHYDEFFTEAQLKALVAFLKTDAGQAMLRGQSALGAKIQQQLAISVVEGKERIDRIMTDSIAEVEKEVQAANVKLFTSPVFEVEERARAGDPVAQYLAGSNFADGKGVEKNAIEAIKWFRMAADQGHPGAQGRLGWAYWKGEGFEKDPARAKELFLQAANRDDMMSMYFLGFMYARGEGGPKDTKQAFPWLLKAANAGHSGAQYEVANLYWNGDGVERNLSEAYAWIRVAEDAGFEAAARFHEFAQGKLSSDQIADGMMRSSEIRRAIKALDKPQRSN